MRTSEYSTMITFFFILLNINKYTINFCWLILTENLKKKNTKVYYTLAFRNNDVMK